MNIQIFVLWIIGYATVVYLLAIVQSLPILGDVEDLRERLKKIERLLTADKQPGVTQAEQAIINEVDKIASIVRKQKDP